jgi:hypothetical protein
MARRGVDKRDWFPLPFTLLDKVLCFALLVKNALSNRVNPLPPREGRFLGAHFLIMLLTEIVRLKI